MHKHIKLSKNKLAKISQIKKSQFLAMKKQLLMWEKIFAHAKWGIAISNPNSNTWELVNPAFAMMHGYTIEELTASHIKVTVAPECQGTIQEEVNIIHGQGNFVFESKNIKKDGTVFPVKIDSTAIYDDAGRVLYRIVNVWDITESKKLEDELSTYHVNLEELVREQTSELKVTNERLWQEISEHRETEKKLTQITQYMHDIICQTDNSGLIHYISPSQQKILCYDTKELIGRNVLELIHLDDRHKIYNKLNKAASSADLLGEEIRCKGVDGKYIWFECFCNPVVFFNGYINGIVFSMRDISLRKQSEEKVRKEQKRLFNVMEELPGFVCLIRSDYSIPYFNNRFRKNFGDPGKKRCYELFHGRCTPCSVCKPFNVFKTLEPCVNEFTTKDRDYVLYDYPFYDVDGSLLLLELGFDITERNLLQKEVLRLDRLNMIGQMAAGIGHEVRNPMTTVRGFLQLLGGKEDCTKYKEYYDLMIEELDRANAIITEFLSLGNIKTVEKEKKNLNVIINTLLPLILSSAIKEEKGINLKLSDVPDLLLDEKEIRQLILNLVRNGLEAMIPGRDLTISTFTKENEVIMAVQDQGKGIDLNVLSKIGTPFFTTKDKGTGLGLAVCYSIAERHNANIKIKTDSTGSVFSVIFTTI